jgi:hypothetical protein
VGCPIESRFVCSDDQRLFDHHALRVVVTPQDSKVPPVHFMVSIMYMFGYGRGIFAVFRSFLDVTGVLTIVVIVGHCRSQCFHSIPNSR